MLSNTLITALLASAVAALPLEERASCTFTTASAAKSGKSSCTNIILDNIAVPAGTTLDMTDLKSGTTVSDILHGIAREAVDLTCTGHIPRNHHIWLRGVGRTYGLLLRFQYQDHRCFRPSYRLQWGQVVGWRGHVNRSTLTSYEANKRLSGSNGGKTKPKAFYAHSLKDSTITGLNVKNTPVQFMSIDGAENLNVVDVTMDNSAGDTDELGHNTDAFDIGSSTGVYISGADIKNQDDCMAINSGTDISFTGVSDQAARSSSSSDIT